VLSVQLFDELCCFIDVELWLLLVLTQIFFTLVYLTVAVVCFMAPPQSHFLIVSALFVCDVIMYSC
jgi:hypothetical protein